MAGAGGPNRIHGNSRIAVGTVFKADRAGERRGHLAVNLAFSSTCSDSAPANEIGDKLSGHHIEKFGRCRYAKGVHLQQ